MQKRKFDELISYFKRKIADMDIDSIYKIELLGMVTALGYAHEKETEERKKGKWIKVNGKTAINCSACYHCSWSWSFEDTVKRFNFCPNCGADMRQKEGA